MAIRGGITLPTRHTSVFPARHRWPVTISNGPLTLRPIRRRDMREWEAVRRRNWDWLQPWEPTVPVEAREPELTFVGLLRALRGQAREGRAIPWIVEWGTDSGTRSLIGQVSVFGLTWGSARSGQLGYWIDQDYAGRGIIPRAVALAMDYCFQIAHLHRLEIVIRPENRNSLRVVEKLGLRDEGIRPRYLHIDGQWRDHRVFAMHSDELAGNLVDRVPLAGA